MSRNGVVRDPVPTLDSSIPPAIAGILQNLSSRPSVESTLVLSRSDGTIICATGNLSTNRRANLSQRPGSAVLVSEGPTRNPTSTEAVDRQESASDADGVVFQKRATNTAEKLALSVFGFVHSATLLGGAVGRSHDDQDGQDVTRTNLYETGSTQIGHDEHDHEDNESATKEDQIQLLRMRTKRQEIIIYPDINYLCCVIQSVGKQANGMT